MIWKPIVWTQMLVTQMLWYSNVFHSNVLSFKTFDTQMFWKTTWHANVLAGLCCAEASKSHQIHPSLILHPNQCPSYFCAPLARFLPSEKIVNITGDEHGSIFILPLNNSKSILPVRYSCFQNVPTRFCGGAGIKSAGGEPHQMHQIIKSSNASH